MAPAFLESRRRSQPGGGFATRVPLVLSRLSNFSDRPDRAAQTRREENSPSFHFASENTIDKVRWSTADTTELRSFSLSPKEV
jgi:hypothetical protein